MDAECISLFAFWIASAFYAFNAFGLDESVSASCHSSIPSILSHLLDFQRLKQMAIEHTSHCPRFCKFPGIMMLIRL